MGTELEVVMAHIVKPPTPIPDGNAPAVFLAGPIEMTPSGLDGPFLTSRLLKKIRDEGGQFGED
jgi:hypothetical protein